MSLLIEAVAVISMVILSTPLLRVSFRNLHGSSTDRVLVAFAAFLSRVWLMLAHAVRLTLLYGVGDEVFVFAFT